MGNFPKLGESLRIPIVLSTPEYLKDHHFQGRPVLPAVTAMDILARMAKETFSMGRINHIVEVIFEKFLYLETDADQLEAIVEFMTLEDGVLQAILLSRTKSKKTAFTRTRVHVRLSFTNSETTPSNRLLDMGAGIEGVCTTVSPEKIYTELVPFGPVFRNIQAPLLISPDGALAQIQTPRQQYHHHDSEVLLGSGYALDAVFHAACVWAQHYRGIVAFPVALDQRTIHIPTCPGKRYIGRVTPKAVSGELLVFDMLILDEMGNICESAEGVQMRDVSGGRLQPPVWIRGG